jgi:hypothetical protein
MTLRFMELSNGWKNSLLRNLFTSRIRALSARTSHSREHLFLVCNRRCTGTRIQAEYPDGGVLLFLRRKGQCFLFLDLECFWAFVPKLSHCPHRSGTELKYLPTAIPEP